MSLHYQVYVEFSLAHGKPQLVRTSIYSTHAACTLWPIAPYYHTYLITSRIFESLQEAKFYIANLKRVYKKTQIPPPVLDSGQKELFSGGQNEN
jgi:hypothetical protein